MLNYPKYPNSDKELIESKKLVEFISRQKEWEDTPQIHITVKFSIGGNEIEIPLHEKLTIGKVGEILNLIGLSIEDFKQFLLK